MDDIPKVPWHDATVRALEPLEPYMTLVLVAIAVGSLWVAFRGDGVTKLAVVAWLIVP